MYEEEIKENNAWLIYAIGVNFAEGTSMHVRICHDTFEQVDQLGTFELVNLNMRTEHQCNGQLSQFSLPWLPGLKKSALEALYEKSST